MPIFPPIRPADLRHEFDPGTLPGHVHRWCIAEQGGPQSAGSCACGTTRVFQNGWGGDRDLVMGSGGWRSPAKARTGWRA